MQRYEEAALSGAKCPSASCNGCISLRTKHRLESMAEQCFVVGGGGVEDVLEHTGVLMEHLVAFLKADILFSRITQILLHLPCDPGKTCLWLKGCR